MEETFAQFKQLPDWDRYPMPEVFYKHFNVKKPKPLEINEICTVGQNSVYTHYESFEERGALPGGVREIPELPPLDVKVEVKTEDKLRIEQMQQTMSTINVDHYQEIKKLWRGVALKDEISAERQQVMQQ